MLSLGAKGVISVVANVLPSTMSKMVHAYIDGDLELARKIQIDLMPIVGAMFCEVNPIPVKEAVNLLGFDVGPCRMPLCEMSVKNKELLIKTMQQYTFDDVNKFLGKN